MCLLGLQAEVHIRLSQRRKESRFKILFFSEILNPKSFPLLSPPPIGNILIRLIPKALEYRLASFNLLHKMQLYENGFFDLLLYLKEDTLCLKNRNIYFLNLILHV